MKITTIKIYKFSIPIEPFAIATGTMYFAQNIYIEVYTDRGLKGVGESSAFPMIVGETQDTGFALAKEFAQLWLGKDALDIDARMAELHAFIAANYTIKSAFDMALYDLSAKERGLPLYKFLNGVYKEPESDLTIGIDTVENMCLAAQDYVENREVRILKVKLGKNVMEDIVRIKAIRAQVGGNIDIRIDANQGYNLQEAIVLLQELESSNIQFCEQPMRSYNDHLLPELMRQTNIPIMADESVYTHHDAERLCREHATHAINIKLSKSGGILEALRIHNVCKLHHVPNMLGGMLESRIGLSANVHLALACPNIIYYDFDSCLLGHKVDPVQNGVSYRGMHLQTPALPGIGAEAEIAFLDSCVQFVVS